MALDVSRLFMPWSGFPLDFMVRYKQELESMKQQLDRLLMMRDGVIHLVEEASRNGEFINPDVVSWLRDVDRMDREAGDLSEEAMSNRKCMNGLFPHLPSRYRLFVKSKKMAEIVVKLRDEGKFDRISFPAPLPVITSITIEAYDILESWISAFRNVMDALHDERLKFVGVHGMAGVGKTTLLKHIRKKAEDNKLFDCIVMVSVSPQWHVERIQIEIADMLGLKFSEESSTGRARRLCNRLKRCKKALLILDDVWDELDLEEIGIPNLDDHDGLKIIITTRLRWVCRQMETQKDFTIEPLSDQDAWSLFRKMAGVCAESADIEPIAREIAGRCGGLPALISSIGRALENKQKSIWTEAANILGSPMDLKGNMMFENVFQTMELSYNCLQSSKIKLCFLLCALFPENYGIGIEDIVRYGVGFRLFNHVKSIIEARNMACSMVDFLQDSNLLLASDKKGFVKMHTAFRNLAIMLSSEGEYVHVVNSGKGLKKWPRDVNDQCVAISMMDNDISKLPDILEYKRLRMLLMQQNHPSLKLPDLSFVETGELGVLDLSYTCILSLPQSLRCLEKLRTLYLKNCKLGDISVLGELKGLEILSLAGSDIKMLPAEIGNLRQLMLLDLENCKELISIAPNVISSLSGLQELYMGNSFVQWELNPMGTSSNASLTELSHLSYLSLAHIHLPDDRMPVKLKCRKLRKLKIFIGSRLKRCNNVANSTSLDVNEGVQIPLVEGVVEWSKTSGNQGFCEMKGVKNIFQLLDGDRISALQFLDIKRCREMEYLTDTREGVPQIAFPGLISLSLYDLVNFKQICSGELLQQSFAELRVLKMKNCISLSNVLTFDLLYCLKNLEILTVDKCNSVQEIFDLTGSQASARGNVLLSKLKILQLKCLPALTHIFKGPDHLVDLQNLCSIEVEVCKKLRSVFSPTLAQTLVQLMELRLVRCYQLEEIITEDKGDQGTVSQKRDFHAPQCFQSLRFLTLSFCHSLRSVFSLSVAKGLFLLEVVDISWCYRMEDIIRRGKGEEGIYEHISFNKLSSMTFQFLPNITSFCPEDFDFNFPLLSTIVVECCPKMRAFAHGSWSLPFMENFQVKDDQWLWMGDLNNTIEQPQ